MASFMLLLCLVASIKISQSSRCHAQCDYYHLTARADCSSRYLDCIPVNYPYALVMDLSHNNISVLEPDDFNGTFTSLIELYLDYNFLTDVRTLLTSTDLGSLEKLSVRHNIISSLGHECRLDSLEKFWVDNNLLTDLLYIPTCRSLRHFSADSNKLASYRLFLFDFVPSFVSLRFNRIYDFEIHRIRSSSNFTFLLDHNEITYISMYLNGYRSQLNLLSLSHNRLTYIDVPTPTRLNVASNELRDLRNGFSLGQRGDKSMEKLDTRNNSFDSLIQPDWADGLQILNADDNLLANLSSTTLQGFINLTELHVANNRLLFISSTALRQLTMLRSLYLDGNALTSLLGGVFLNQAELVELSITNNQLTVLHPDYFIGLDSLTRLHLAGNQLFYVHSEMLRQMPRLVTMDLSENKLDVFDLGNCDHLTDLRNLVLTHNSINDISEILGHCDNLAILDMRFNHIEVVPSDSLSGRNRALSRLELEGNPLQCDCRLTGLRDWLLNNPPSALTRCQGPARHVEAVITDLDIHDFSCEPPKAVTNPNHLQIAVGQTATLSCTATGIPTPNVTWLDLNGTVISDKWQGRFVISQDMTLHIISIQKYDQGTYTCLVENILGRKARAVVDITVKSELPSSSSLAVSVVPTMFITLIATLIVVALVICVGRRYKKKDQPSGPAEGLSVDPKLKVRVRKTKATRSEGGYVNEAADDTYMTPTIEKDTDDNYEVTMTTTTPPSRYQTPILPKKDDAGSYEPMSIGSVA